MAQRIVIPGFRKIETSGGGEGGTSNYNDLTNKPSINNVPLVGKLNTVNLKLTDATLTEEGVPAEAKTVGELINKLNLNKQDKNCYVYNVKYMEFLSTDDRSEIKWKISDTESYLVQFLNDGHIGYFHSTDGEKNWQTIFMK